MKNKFGISKNVFVLGLVSFFNDVASEMIYPIVPIFLTGVLGAPVAVVGLIEGIAESTASVLKVVSGWLSDKLQKRKPFVVAGYSFSAISKILLSLAFSWPFVLFARFVDRFGKGTRTSARDALIAESSETSTRGKSFGFHRALDTLGAVVGPLIALLAIHFLDNNFRLIFFLAFIPACIGIILLLFFVKERQKENNPDQAIRFSWRNLDPSFKIFLLISFIFALGNSSDAFLILRAQNLGLSVILVVLAYVLLILPMLYFQCLLELFLTRLDLKKCFWAAFCFFLRCIFSLGWRIPVFSFGSFFRFMEYIWHLPKEWGKPTFLI